MGIRQQIVVSVLVLLGIASSRQALATTAEQTLPVLPVTSQTDAPDALDQEESDELGEENYSEERVDTWLGDVELADGWYYTHYDEYVAVVYKQGSSFSGYRWDGIDREAGEPKKEYGYECFSGKIASSMKEIGTVAFQQITILGTYRHNPPESLQKDIYVQQDKFNRLPDNQIPSVSSFSKSYCTYVDIENSEWPDDIHVFGGELNRIEFPENWSFLKPEFNNGQFKQVNLREAWYNGYFPEILEGIYYNYQINIFHSDLEKNIFGAQDFHAIQADYNLQAMARILDAMCQYQDVQKILQKPLSLHKNNPKASFERIIQSLYLYSRNNDYRSTSRLQEDFELLSKNYSQNLVTKYARAMSDGSILGNLAFLGLDVSILREIERKYNPQTLSSLKIENEMDSIKEIYYALSSGQHTRALEVLSQNDLGASHSYNWERQSGDGDGIDEEVAETLKTFTGLEEDQYLISIYVANGEFQKALEVYLAKVDAYAQLNDQFKSYFSDTYVMIHHDIAELYQMLGNEIEAEEHYELAQDYLKVNPGGPEVASMASYLHLKNKNYVAFLESSIDVFELYIDRSILTLSDLIRQRRNGRDHMLVAQAYKGQGKLNKARQLYGYCLCMFEDYNLKERLEILINLSEINTELADPNQSLNQLLQALPIAQSMENNLYLGKLFGDIGNHLNRDNQPELAILFYKQSVNAWETIRHNNRGLPTELQDSYTESVAGTYRKLADLLLQQDRIFEAQQVLDLLRVREIDDYLRDVRGNENTLHGISLVPLEKQIMALYEPQFALDRELANLQKIKPFERTIPQWERITAILDHQAARSQNPYDFLLQPAVMGHVQNLQREAREQRLAPETLYNLQDDLKQLDNAVALYPLVLEDRLELVLVSANQPPIRRKVPVRRIQLNLTIEKFRQALRNSSSDPRPKAQQLYRWLIEPIEDELKDAETVLYAGDGQLRYVPLAALYDGSDWLVERFRINNITAASVTDFSKTRKKSTKILAGAFSDKQQTYDVNIGDLPTMSFRGLKFAGIEVDKISNLFPQTTIKFINEQFNKQALVPKMKDYDILHFATHANFVTGYPEESFILLGDGDRINLREISDWKLPEAALVVLSACETAVSGILGNGEELLGFGYQIQRTGAKASLSSLWKVDDQGTQSLMTLFYEVLKTTNVSKAEALRRAQVALIRDDVSILNQGLLRNGNFSDDSGNWSNKITQFFTALWQWFTQFFGSQDAAIVSIPLTDSLQSSVPTLELVSARSGIPNMFELSFLTQASIDDINSLEGPKHPYYWAPFILLGNGL